MEEGLRLLPLVLCGQEAVGAHLEQQQGERAAQGHERDEEAKAAHTSTRQPLQQGRGKRGTTHGTLGATLGRHADWDGEEHACFGFSELAVSKAADSN